MKTKDEEKDMMRVKGIVSRGEGNKDKEIQLAKQMANSIDTLSKAKGRKEAAQELSLPHIAEVFAEREEELKESTSNGILKHLILFEDFDVIKHLKVDEAVEKSDLGLVKKILDKLLDEDDEEYAETCDKIDDFFSSMDEDKMEEFCDEVKMPRKFDIGFLMDDRIWDWPEKAQEKAIEYLLKHDMITTEGKWKNKEDKK